MVEVMITLIPLTRIAAFLTVFVTGSAMAERVLPQCQTEESRGLRFTSEAMYKAAEASDPWRGCQSGCTMQSSVVESMEITKRNFQAQALAAILKARALEAAHCPQWSQAIISVGPVTDEEKTEVKAEYDRLMKDQWDEYRAMIKWQNDHPQCKHVEWTMCGSSDGHDCSSKEDLSGNFMGKAGYCSVDGHGPSLLGYEDDMTNSNPETNERIGQVACSQALGKYDLGDGLFPDSKVCTGTAP